MRNGFSKHGYPVPTEGHRLLRDAIRGSSAPILAKQLGLSPQALHYLFRDQRPPSRRTMDKMREVFGIEPGAWYDPPTSAEVLATIPAPPMSSDELPEDL